MPRPDTLALDRASVRTIDADGRLHVAMANISKANVCPYWGKEIPDWQGLGLDPEKSYQLFRAPDELAKAADSFNNQPLLSQHRPHSINDHKPDLIVGSTGTDAVFNDPYLQNSLVVWEPVALAGITSDEQRELSCGYYYDADMTPGEYQGARYDGVMRNIRANHIALVTEGRAGPDVMVGDAAIKVSTKPQESPDMPKSAPALSRKALLASGALRAYLKPKIAADAKIDFAPMLATVNAKNWKAQKPRIKVALDAAVKGKLAKDADIEDVIEMLDTLDDVTDEIGEVVADPANNPEDDGAEDGDADMIDRVKEFLAGKLSDEDMASVLAMMKPEVDTSSEVKPAVDADKPVVPAPPAVAKPEVTKAAMDAAILIASTRAAKAAETATIARLRSIQEAERVVRPYIGELAIAQDSAEAVYKLALDTADIDLTGVPPAAYAAMVKMLPNPGAEPTQRPRQAMDSKANADLSKRFPGALSLKQR